jgi:hypothetical protein
MIYLILIDILYQYSNPKSFVNLLLPNRGFGEGWGGVKNLRLLQELLDREPAIFVVEQASCLLLKKTKKVHYFKNNIL